MSFLTSGADCVHKLSLGFSDCIQFRELPGSRWFWMLGLAEVRSPFEISSSVLQAVRHLYFLW